VFKIEFETGDEDFEDRIVERAAGRLVEQFSEDAQDKLRHMVEEKAAVVVEEAIRKVASEQWVETNRYGEPTGAKTSLADLVRQQLTKETSARYGAESKTFVQTTIDNVVAGVLRQEFRPIIDEACAQLRKQLGEAFAGSVKDAIAQIMGVRLT